MVRNIFKIVVLIAIGILLGSDKSYIAQMKNMRGIKLYFDHLPESFQQDEFRELIKRIIFFEFNAVFTPAYEGANAYYQSELLENTGLDLQKFKHELLKEEIEFGIICPVFHDPHAFREIPYIQPVDQFGSKEQNTWQKFVCPSNEEYRNYKINIIVEAIEKLTPDYVCLDFIRFPIHWEMVSKNEYQNVIRNFCFCKNCIKNFIQYSKIDTGDNQNITELISTDYKELFAEWKTFQITSFVSNLKNRIRTSENKIKIIVQTIPWLPKEFNGAIKNIAGQDVKALSEIADFISPMIYSDLLKRDLSFRKSLLDDFNKSKINNILPSFDLLENRFNNVEEIKDFIHREFSDNYILFHFGRLVITK